ncbi:hypothetical protein D9M71_833370 [compost metagenome]
MDTVVDLDLIADVRLLHESDLLGSFEFAQGLQGGPGLVLGLKCETHVGLQPVHVFRRQCPTRKMHE